MNSAFFNALQNLTEGIGICELITIVTPNSTHIYATANDTIVRSGDTYDSFQGATGTGVEERMDMTVSAIDFMASNSGGLFDAILDSSGLDFAPVTIERVLTSSPDIGSYIVFTGRIAGQSYNRNAISGEVRNLYDGVNIKIPHHTYQDACAWRFGSDGCAFDTSSITTSSAVALSSESSNLHVTVLSGTLSPQGDAHFDLGRVTFVSGVNSGQVRTIRFQIGDGLDLSHPLPFDISSGDNFDIFRGCRKRLVEDCLSAFNNTSNYLGFPWIPKQQNAI